MGKLDKPTLTGLAVCALPVAAFSAWSQFETARLAGVPAQLAWVLPMTTDATAFVSTRAWLDSRYPRGVRDWAAFLSLACIVLSVAGAAAHLVLMDMAAPPFWVKLTVGGLPSLALAGLVHLGALIAAGNIKPKAATKNTGGAGHRPPTSAPSAPIPSRGNSTETGSGLKPAGAGASRVESPPPAADVIPAASVEPAPTTPEIGAGSTRDRMLAHLDQHGEVSGADLDRIFGTRDYGRGVLRTWRKRHPVASGE